MSRLMLYGPAIGALVLLAVVCALVYGLFLQSSPRVLLRASVKAGMAGSLALALALAGAPLPLVAALAFCALGDYWLALGKEWAFSLGMLAFLIAHAAFMLLFGELRLTAEAADPVWPRVLVGVGLFLGAIGVIGWLWTDLGWRKAIVPIYACALIGMAIMAWSLPWSGWLAMVGALLFVFSDGVLAAQTFRKDLTGVPPILQGHSIVWWSYAAAIGLLTLGAMAAGISSSVPLMPGAL
jgi:uncharacterized membrane protein YhhN